MVINQIAQKFMLPFSRSWWVEPGMILAGCYPGDLDPAVAHEKISALLDAGMRSFICLQEENEKNEAGLPFKDYRPLLEELAQKRGTEIDWKRFPIKDNYIPKIAEMENILKAIEESLQQNKPVYVHCWGGHGRTGTVIGCWLVKQGLTAKEALECMSMSRLHNPALVAEKCPQTQIQENMIFYWSKISWGI